jgi:microcystin-dependent protein
MILPYAGGTIPNGYLLCDGSAVSRTTYAALFVAIGTTWGVGNGSTTFNLPDLRGRALLGSGTGGGLTERLTGASAGEEGHILSVNEMPSHMHSYGDSHLFVSWDSYSEYSYVAGSGELFDAVMVANSPLSFSIVNGWGITNTGGGSSHNNMQPWAAINYLIKT